MKSKKIIFLISLIIAVFLYACEDENIYEDQSNDPVENEDPITNDRPALLFTADDFNILKSQYAMIPDNAKGKKFDVHEAWFSENETLQKEQTQWWIDYWKNYSERWTAEALSDPRPDGVSMRGIWRTMHLFDIVVSWGYLSESDVDEYRNAVVNAVELALGADTNNLGANIDPDFRTHNIYTDVFLAAGLVGLSFPDLEQSNHWIKFAEQEMNYQFETSIFGSEDLGAWHECPRYHGYVLKLYTQYFLAVRNRTGIDYFQRNEFKSLTRWFVKFSTPKVELAGNAVLIPGIGDTTWDTEWHGPLNIIAQQYKETDPELSKALAWIWKEAGSPYDVEHTMDILIDPGIVSEEQNLSSLISEEKGHILMRARHGQDDEIWFMLKCGKRSLNGHENGDWNSFSLIAYGQPMALDAGAGDYNDDHSRNWNKKAWAHNMVLFRDADETDPLNYNPQKWEDGSVLLWHTDNEVDYSITDASEPSLSAKNIRHVIFMKPDYFIIKDEIEPFALQFNRESSWLLHTLTNKNLEWGKRYITSHTLNNTALDIHVVLPERDLVANEWEGRIGAWIPGEDEEDDFYGYKYQKYFEVRGKKSENYLTVINPRKETMPKLEVVSNDGGKNLENNTGERQDVITLNE